VSSSPSSKALQALSQIKRAMIGTLVERARQKQLKDYFAAGQRPWSPGYNQHKFAYLEKTLHDDSLMAAFRERKALPAGYGFRLDARVVEIPWALSYLQDTQRILLDAGSSLNHGVVVDAPALQNRQLTIFTLAPEKSCFWQKGISYMFGDLREMLFRDDAFDVVVCISTIEHIGMDNTQYAGDVTSAQKGGSTDFVQAVKELKRLLKPGGVLYITFPFGRYENHGWFQQFDARLTDQLIQAFNPARFSETIFHYKPDGWVLSDRETCAECQFFDVHTSKYFDPTSTIEYPPDYPAGERALACLELVK
jgi:SAM-dependent methyltransferase